MSSTRAAAARTRSKSSCSPPDRTSADAPSSAVHRERVHRRQVVGDDVAPASRAPTRSTSSPTACPASCARSAGSARPQRRASTRLTARFRAARGEVSRSRYQLRSDWTSTTITLLEPRAAERTLRHQASADPRYLILKVTPCRSRSAATGVGLGAGRGDDHVTGNIVFPVTSERQLSTRLERRAGPPKDSRGRCGSPSRRPLLLRPAAARALVDLRQ